jgi:valyl-tRNA synthetase
VDREFGTGALKITPGHDPNDFAIGEKHNLEVISILDESARLTSEVDLTPDRIDLKPVRTCGKICEGKLVIKKNPNIKRARSQRGGEIVEPMVSTQWFVRIQPLADAALEAVRDGRIRIVPERFTKVYYNWLENIQDWCISRNYGGDIASRFGIALSAVK